MTKYVEIFSALGASFGEGEVRVRSQGGRQLSYITARTAMNRLDSVLGPENWWDEYIPGEHSVICRLTIRLPDGSTLTKSDAGGYAGMADQGDDDKSGFSDAFKRAAVKFGVGRYLYRDGVPSFVASVPIAPRPEDIPAERRDPEPGPSQPGAAPGDHAPEPSRASGERQSSSRHPGAAGQADRPPTSGRALFAWTKKKEEEHQVGLLKYLNGWAKLQDFPGRMVDWGEEEVRLGYGEAIRKLQSIGHK